MRLKINLTHTLMQEKINLFMYKVCQTEVATRKNHPIL